MANPLFSLWNFLCWGDFFFTKVFTESLQLGKSTNCADSLQFLFCRKFFIFIIKLHHCQFVQFVSMQYYRQCLYIVCIICCTSSNFCCCCGLQHVRLGLNEVLLVHLHNALDSVNAVDCVLGWCISSQIWKLQVRITSNIIF